MVPILPTPAEKMGDIPRKSYAKLPPILDVPNLIAIQLDSFQWFQEKGLMQLLEEVSPIKDFIGTRLELSFISYEFRTPRHSEQECRQRDLTYSAPLYVKARLLVKETGEIKEEDIFFSDIPLMTSNGTFITSGAERVVVSQLLRSPGVYFTLEEDVTTGRKLCHAKLIPTRGAWLEFETNNRNVISAKINGKRKIPVTTLLRAIGYSDNEQLLSMFSEDDSAPEHQFIKTTLEREPWITSESEALIDIYKKLRPGDPPNIDNAKKLINNLFFNSLRYDLGTVGRYKIKKRLKLKGSEKARALTREDIIEIIRHIIMVNNEKDTPDEIDHLGNRRVRTVGELIQNQFRIGLLRLERVIKQHMSIIATETVTPSALVNIRPVAAAVREFFGGSQLSQFMDQTNPLAELTHKRRLSAMGPGGLSRERAGFDVRDVHFSHYGRICPIETPEGPNIGLIGSPAAYSKINEFGFIETPYRWVITGVTNTYEGLSGKTARETVLDGKGKAIRDDKDGNLIDAGDTITPQHISQLSRLPADEAPKVVPLTDAVVYISADYDKLLGKTITEAVLNDRGSTIVEAGGSITPEVMTRLSKLSPRIVKVVPFVSTEVVYLTADKEDVYTVAQANAKLDENNQFISERIEARHGDHYVRVVPDQIDFMDVSPKQIVSVGTSLIPFLEHDDANRALMGANMQRQAVPLLRPEAPLVATGMEIEAAKHSGQLLFAQNAGVVSSVSSTQIVVTRDNGDKDLYPLMKFVRTNQGTCISQRPIVHKFDRVEEGQLLSNSSATEQGELALGQNVLCAFMSWEGYNYEDAIIISNRLLEEDKFTSIHIAKFEVEARDTKLGPEEITRDIPNVGEESLRELDETGIIRVGAEVGPNDILVGKITPKGETELSAEEKLLRAIFGEKAREVKDTSLRVPHGDWGKIINVRVFSRDNGDELSSGVNQWVQVWVAQKRGISVGDKLSGRHGNKGVIALIASTEDMPFLPDGTPVDIILNPIGVPSRMNLGQVMETHLGWAAQILDFKVLTPVFDGADDIAIEDALARAWLAQKAGAVNPDPGNEKPAISLDLAKAWLKSHGYKGNRVFSDDYPGEAKKACLRLWLEDLGISSRDLNQQELEQAVERVNAEYKLPPPTVGKVVLRDGRTGTTFDQPVTVGNIYMMKLIHLVEDKVHARSTGPYSLITQQPLGGKAQFGGQRFGEMEVWALEAYGSAHNLQEFLTIKSDDVTGRAKTYEAIVKNEEILQSGVPESFKVLVKELQSLGLAIEVINDDEQGVILAGETTKVPKPETELEIIGDSSEIDSDSEVPKLETVLEVIEGSTDVDSDSEVPKPETVLEVTEGSTDVESDSDVPKPETVLEVTEDAADSDSNSTLGEVEENA